MFFVDGVLETAQVSAFSQGLDIDEHVGMSIQQTHQHGQRLRRQYLAAFLTGKRVVPATGQQ